MASTIHHSSVTAAGGRAVKSKRLGQARGTDDAANWTGGFNLKRAVETTDGHRWTQIRRTCEDTRAHPEAEQFFREKSVFICVHLWFPFSSENSTAESRINHLIPASRTFQMRYNSTVARTSRRQYSAISRYLPSASSA